jgi:hypothetical protein
MSDQTGLFITIGVIILCCFFESISWIERSKCHFGYLGFSNSADISGWT